MNLSDGVRKALVAEYIPDGAGTLRRTETGELIRTPCSNKQHMWVVRNGEAPTPDTDAAALEAVAS
jgi:hypothetical protein